MMDITGKLETGFDKAYICVYRNIYHKYVQVSYEITECK